ncbi:transposase [Streptomyces sp. RS2]|uniref:transposase n=1 Tax=Streptomyces sp. RS2 TaxID=1451205 RepID=UPI0035A97227
MVGVRFEPHGDSPPPDPAAPDRAWPESGRALPRLRLPLPGQKTDTCKDKYALRAGVEGAINQALDITGIRRARYRGLPRVRLQHASSPAAINTSCLDAHWASSPLDRTRTLERLNYDSPPEHQELRSRVVEVLKP